MLSKGYKSYIKVKFQVEIKLLTVNEKNHKKHFA